MLSVLEYSGGHIIDYVIMSGFYRKGVQSNFLEELIIMMILRKRQSRAKGRYKSKRSMTFSKSKHRSSLWVN